MIYKSLNYWVLDTFLITFLHVSYLSTILQPCHLRVTSASHFTSIYKTSPWIVNIYYGHSNTSPNELYFLVFKSSFNSFFECELDQMSRLCGKGDVIQLWIDYGKVMWYYFHNNITKISWIPTCTLSPTLSIASSEENQLSCFTPPSRQAHMTKTNVSREHSTMTWHLSL